VSIHPVLRRGGGILLGGLAGVPFSAVLAWAAEGEVSWRATYDLVMMWVNFGILAFLLMKYVRARLLNMLKGEAEKTATGLTHAQTGKEQADRTIEETLRALETARERMRGIQEKILAEGVRERQRIIESARHESELLLERTSQKIDSQISEAHMRLKAELVDRAVGLALKRLPLEITVEEQLRLIDRFVREAQPS